MDENCTLYKTADFIGKRWTLPILLELHKGQGARRYNELKKRLPGITSKVLAMRLRELEEQKIITKIVDNSTIPIKSEYSLTKSGIDFIDIIKDVKEWALKWNIKRKECECIDCEKCNF